jgi:hypothetical protein
MLSRLQWWWLQLSRRLWVRATAFSMLGIVTALIALLVKTSSASAWRRPA